MNQESQASAKHNRTYHLDKVKFDCKLREFRVCTMIFQIVSLVLTCYSYFLQFTTRGLQEDQQWKETKGYNFPVHQNFTLHNTSQSLMEGFLLFAQNIANDFALELIRLLILQLVLFFLRTSPIPSQKHLNYASLFIFYVESLQLSLSIQDDARKGKFHPSLRNMYPLVMM